MLLTQAVETEVADFLERYTDLKTKAGHQRVVRHGHLPERDIMTGIGAVPVRQPRVRDREVADGERIWSSLTIVPPYARRTKSLEVLIPMLYLKGVSNRADQKDTARGRSSLWHLERSNRAAWLRLPRHQGRGHHGAQRPRERGDKRPLQRDRLHGRQASHRRKGDV